MDCLTGDLSVRGMAIAPLAQTVSHAAQPPQIHLMSTEPVVHLLHERGARLQHAVCSQTAAKIN